MLNNIINLREFHVVTFSSTQAAMQAEKVLMEAGLDIILIPTPREISASCGLTVKCACHDIEAVTKKLKEFKVDFNRVHHIKR